MQYELPAAAVKAAALYKIEREDLPKLLDEAVSLHNKAIDGDTEAAAAASDLLKKLYSNFPGDKKIQAYLGSATTLKGRDLINPMDRMKFALRGLKMLDQAVSGDSGNVEIRLLRANVCLRLPEDFFHRMDTAAEDFKYLIDRYDKNNSTLTEELHLDVLFKLGCACISLNRREEAEAAWKRIRADAGAEKYKEYMSKVNSEKPDKVAPESPAREGPVREGPARDTTQNRPASGLEPKKKAWRRL